LIKRDKIIIYRYFLRSFNFINLNDKNKDLIYKFIRKVYDIFILIYLIRIRSAITQLFNLKFDLFIFIISTKNDLKLTDL